MGDSLPRTLMKLRAKFDAASFVIGGEILNRANTHNYKKTDQKQTINEISTPCMPACVDNNHNNHDNMYVGRSYCRAEMYAVRVACCPLVSHGEYAPRALLRLKKTGQTDTDGRQNVRTLHYAVR